MTDAGRGRSIQDSPRALVWGVRSVVKAVGAGVSTQAGKLRRRAMGLAMFRVPLLRAVPGGEASRRKQHQSLRIDLHVVIAVAGLPLAEADRCCSCHPGR